MSAVRDRLLELLALPDEALETLVAGARGEAHLAAQADLIAEGHEEHAPAERRFELSAVLDLISGLHEVAGVREIRYSSDEGFPSLWLLVEGDIDSATERIAQLDYDFRRATRSLTYALHVVPLDAVAEQDLPVARSI